MYARSSLNPSARTLVYKWFKMALYLSNFYILMFNLSKNVLMGKFGLENKRTFCWKSKVTWGSSMKACENVFKLMVYQGLLIGYMVKGTKIIKCLLVLQIIWYGKKALQILKIPTCPELKFLLRTSGFLVCLGVRNKGLWIKLWAKNWSVWIVDLTFCTCVWNRAFFLVCSARELQAGARAKHH